MGRYVRPGDRKHHRTTVWAAAVLVVLVTAALAIVLPAVGSDDSRGERAWRRRALFRESFRRSPTSAGATSAAIRQEHRTEGPATPSGMEESRS